jgi:hypothetical protein
MIAAGDDSNTPGSQWLASCIQAGRTLSVLFVLDVSGSLADTDPSGSRYAGLKTAMSTLAASTGANDQDVVIEAGIAGFGNQYYGTGEIVPWQRINVDSPGKLIDTMVDQARDRTIWRADGTGFQFVVDPAVKELVARGGAQSCKAIVWFTDGDPSDPEAVVDMCRPGGAVDKMREAGITLIGLRLNEQGAPAASPEMEEMTLGQAGPNTCGTVPLPEGSAPGIYLAASDVKRLFASIQNIVEGCTPTGAIGHHIDPGIRRVRVNFTTAKRVDAVTFDLPGGISFTADTNKTDTHDGIVVASVRDDYYVSMELVLPPGVGVGDWVVSVPGAPSADEIEFCVFSDLHLALDDSSLANLKAGGGAVVVVDVLDPDDKTGDLSPFETQPGVSLVGPDGTPRTATATVDETTNTLDLLVSTEKSDARLDLDVSLGLTTESGLVLTPLRLATPVVTQLNEFFPTVTPLDELDLGEALREDPVSGTITMVGSKKGPTQVCFADPEQIMVPPAATDADPFYQTGCIDLAVGETKTVTVTESTSTAVEGDGSALIPIAIKAAPDETGYAGVADLKLPVHWRFSNPLNVTFLIFALVGVILGSILIPLLALLWANRVTGRFDVSNLRVHVADPFLIDQNGLRRGDPIDGAPDALVGSGSRSQVRGRRSLLMLGRRMERRFTIEGVTFRSKVSWWNPFRPARFWAESAPGTVLVSTYGTQSARDQRRNAAPFAPAFRAAAVWVSNESAIPASGPAAGKLIVLETTGGKRDAKVDADAIIRGANWPSAIAALRPKTDRTEPRSPGNIPKPPPINRQDQGRRPPPAGRR